MVHSGRTTEGRGRRSEVGRRKPEIGNTGGDDVGIKFEETTVGSSDAPAEPTQALAVIEPQPIIVAAQPFGALAPKLIADAGESAARCASSTSSPPTSAIPTPAPPTRSPSVHSFNAW